MNSKQVQVEKDLQNKKVTVIREFSAPQQMVWSAWTESEYLDMWWAPDP